MKIIYVARDLGNIQNGASQVMKRNLKALKEIVGPSNVVEYMLPPSSLKNVVKSIISLGSYGIPHNIEKDLILTVSQINPDYVFIESSSYGTLFQKIKKHKIKTICFAHNLDTKLCKEELFSRNLLISIPKYILTRINEKRTSRHTDILICLTNRDSDGFNSIFNRKADAILPITFPIKEINPTINKDDSKRGNYFLFVGSDFFPNVEGIIWFIKNVAPYIDKNFRIVGGCCDNPSLKHLPLPSNVELVGYAENIENEYANAIGVIAPIFKGSGMKTKTIEALSYGKSIYGTSEAFVGINADFSAIGALCNSANEFIEALQKAKPYTINEYSKLLFEQKFADDVFINELSVLLRPRDE